MTIVKTIGTGAGLGVTPDYADINAWNTYLSTTNFGSGAGVLTEDHVGRLLWNSSANELVTSAAQILQSFTPGAFRVTLEAGSASGAAGGSFKDHANKLTNPLRYSASVGAGVRKTSGTSSILRVLADNVTVRNLQFCYDNTTDVDNGVFITGQNLIVQNCIFSEIAVSTLNFLIRLNATATATFTNCLILISHNTNVTYCPNVKIDTTARADFTNCAIVCTDAAAGSVGCHITSTNATVSTFTNCVFYGQVTDTYNDAGGLAGTKTNCATSLASGSSGLDGGTACQFSLVGATEFQSVTQGAEDFRLKSTSVKCRDDGTAANAPTTDIVGQNRS